MLSEDFMRPIAADTPVRDTPPSSSGLGYCPGRTLGHTAHRRAAGAGADAVVVSATAERWRVAVRGAVRRTPDSGKAASNSAPRWRRQRSHRSSRRCEDYASSRRLPLSIGPLATSVAAVAAQAGLRREQLAA